MSRHRRCKNLIFVEEKNSKCARKEKQIMETILKAIVHLGHRAETGLSAKNPLNKKSLNNFYATSSAHDEQKSFSEVSTIKALNVSAPEAKKVRRNFLVLSVRRPHSVSVEAFSLLALFVLLHCFSS